jgi:hypothetical protein
VILIDVLEYLLVALLLVLFGEHHGTIYIMTGPFLLVVSATTTCYTFQMTLPFFFGRVLRWRPLLKDGELSILYLVVELEGVLWEAEDDPEADKQEILRQEIQQVCHGVY